MMSFLESTMSHALHHCCDREIPFDFLPAHRSVRRKATKQAATAAQNQAEAWFARLANKLPRKKKRIGNTNRGVQAIPQYKPTLRLLAITAKSKGLALMELHHVAIQYVDIISA